LPVTQQKRNEINTLKTVYAICEEVRSGATTCEAEVTRLLAEEQRHRHLNIFLEVWADEALQEARRIDAKIKAGTAGRLAGAVLALKDNICVSQHKVSASSRILEGFTSLYSSTVAERLLAEDAIFLGRVNCDEFAMGSSNENSAYGPVRNPIDPERVPGGSSGGSAAAVAAGLVHAALGTDTGGSIRQPASFTGTVGLKPTYGRVSRHGIIAYGSSFDQVGPITHTVADAALLLELMAGADAYDTTASKRAVAPYTQHLHLSGKRRIAVLQECIESPGLNPAVKASVEAVLDLLRQEGHEVAYVEFPYLKYLVPTYYVLTTAEASSNLSRYSGVHYGYRSLNASDLENTYKQSRSKGFGAEVKRRIMLGTFVLSAGYYDAYYAKGQKVRRVIRDHTNSLFQSFDAILTPTTPGPAFKFGQKGSDPIQMYLEDIYTVQANICGIPAITVPCGKTEEGLPMGVQLMTKAFDEEQLLAFAHHLETLLTPQK
jgi:aspartyl-tRNA(Asn)/glutamyl-tRNA(Gln) amidotransferase subunit A